MEPGRERVHGQWLGHELQTLVQQAAVDGSSLGVAGDEQHLEARTPDPWRVGELRAAHASGQAHISDQQVDPGPGL